MTDKMACEISTLLANATLHLYGKRWPVKYDNIRRIFILTDPSGVPRELTENKLHQTLNSLKGFYEYITLVLGEPS